MRQQRSSCSDIAPRRHVCRLGSVLSLDWLAPSTCIRSTSAGPLLLPSPFSNSHRFCSAAACWRGLSIEPTARTSLRCHGPQFGMQVVIGQEGADELLKPAAVEIGKCRRASVVLGVEVMASVAQVELHDRRV